MNAKESLPHALGRKALDAMIRREYGGWPPNTPSGRRYRLITFTSPTAPKSRCPNRRTKSKSHAAVLSPSHLKCGGLFYACFSKNSQKVQIIREHFLRY